MDQLNFTLTPDNDLTGQLVITNNSDDKTYDTSLANGIRRSIIDSSLCYAMAQTISPEQISNFNTHLSTDIHVPDETESENFIRSAVTLCNFDNIEKLSHRITRIPIYYGPETMDFLKQTVYIALVGETDHEIGGAASGAGADMPSHPHNFEKPYTHKLDKPLFVHSRDLSVYYVDESGITQMLPKDNEMYTKLFPINTHVFTLNKGNTIHMLTQIISGIGHDGS